ncbi:hypothetical protein QMTAC487_12530 [Sphaerotilus sp. FB-3]|jgi:hypothetical protein|nr:hypothetical protein QMTAC487_12530 [Sphaerotilus sp. FB-3]
MPYYTIAATAYDKDGRILNSNTHKIETSNQSDAIEIAKSRQRTSVNTVKVEARVIRVSDRN